MNGSIVANSGGFIVSVRGYYACMPKLLHLLLAGLIPSDGLDRGHAVGSEAESGAASTGLAEPAVRANDPLHQIPFTRRFFNIREQGIRSRRSMLLGAGSLVNCMRQRAILVPPLAHPTEVLPVWQGLT